MVSAQCALKLFIRLPNKTKVKLLPRRLLLLLQQQLLLLLLDASLLQKGSLRTTSLYRNRRISELCRGPP